MQERKKERKKERKNSVAHPIQYRPTKLLPWDPMDCLAGYTSKFDIFNGFTRFYLKIFIRKKLRRKL